MDTTKATVIISWHSIWEKIRRVIQIFEDNKFYQVLLMILVLFIGLWIIESVMRPLKKQKVIRYGFLNGVAKAAWIIAVGMRICSLSSTLTAFGSQILMSSSLIVVVLGFVFQEGLSNIVHGFILTIFKPFSIGDRVSVRIEGETVTGYVASVDLRSTIITNVANSSSVIVPNAKMDTSIIDNSYFDEKTHSSNFLDLTVSYETDLEAAIALFQKIVAEHPYVAKCRAEKEMTEPVSVLVRAFEDSGIAVRIIVTTDTVEENFTACSDIRRTLAAVIRDREDIAFAYPHVQIVK